MAGSEPAETEDPLPRRAPEAFDLWSQALLRWWKAGRGWTSLPEL